MTIFQNALLAIALYILQPTFIIGVLLLYLSVNRRFSYSRRQLRTSIYKERYEYKRFFLWGLFPGIILSLVSVIAGLPVTLDWIIAYQIVTLLLLGFGFRFIHPLFSFPLSALGLIVLGQFFPYDESVSTMLDMWHSPFAGNELLTFQGMRSIFVLAVLILLSTILTLHLGKMNQLTPRFLKTKRGKLVARYRMTPFWLLPLVVIVPGDTFTRLFSWWPVFTLGSQSYSFLFVPVLLGFRYTVQAQMPTQAKNMILKDFLFLGALSAALFALSFWQIEFAAAGLLVLLIGGTLVLYRHRIRERKWDFCFGPAEEGLRVVAVKPDSPAEKMGLDIGDVLLEANQMTLSTVENLTESLFLNRTYCKLKVRRIDGELVMTETTIYEDDAHDLGLIVLEEIDVVK